MVSCDGAKNLVVGAGFSGAVIANLIATRLGEKVLVLNKKPTFFMACCECFNLNDAIAMALKLFEEVFGA